MRVTRAAIGAPAELTLRLKRHATLDVREDTPLTLRVINLCDASPLLDAPRMECAEAAAVAERRPIPSAAVLSTAVLVRSGGAPPGRPGSPVLISMRSYSKVRVAWAPPAYEGGSAVRGYMWVDYVSRTPVLTGEAVEWGLAHDNTTCYSELAGYQKGYGVLPGAVAPLNLGGYGEFSAPWPTATMGRPNAPVGPLARVDGGALEFEWGSPDWDGGCARALPRVRAPEFARAARVLGSPFDALWPAGTPSPTTSSSYKSARGAGRWCASTTTRRSSSRPIRPPRARR